MTSDGARRGTRDGRARRYRARPQLEGLEDRLLLYSTTGGAWTHPERITFSFVPDGTGVGGTPSTLFQSLNTRFPTATWVVQFMEAAAVWEQVAGINLVKVNDDGAALGAGPYQQGDPNHGDIRIAGVGQSLGQLGVTFLAPPINGGDIAGDVIINSGEPWQINSDYDLLTVAIHEIGHALGMGHSQIQQADMYAYYNGVKQSLNSDDVAGVQSIYGARRPDNWNAYFHNNAMSSAIDMTPLIDGNGQIALSRLDINTTSSSEWWKVTVPSTNSGSMVVTMQTTNLSEMSPAVAVYNASGAPLNASTAPGYLGATVGVTIANVLPGQVYYVKAGAANDGPSGAGGYGLLLNFGSAAQAPIPPAYTTVADQPSQGGGSLSDKTDKLSVDPRWDHDRDGAGGPATQDGATGAQASTSAWTDAIDAGLLVAPTPEPIRALVATTVDGTAPRRQASASLLG